MDIATCLLDLGILSTNSIDAQGRERFHPLILQILIIICDIYFNCFLKFSRFKVSEHWFPNKLPDWMYTASLNGIQNVFIINYINFCYKMQYISFTKA
jgi:hypothetical protein